MDKNKELAKNTIIITIGKICTQFLSFFLMPLYTSVLSTEEYGVVDLVLTYTSMLMPLVLLQVNEAFFRFLVDVRQLEKEKTKIVSTGLIFLSVQIIISTGVFIVLSGLITTGYKWPLLINLIGSVLSSMMMNMARGLGYTNIFAISSFLSAATQIIGNILLLLVFKFGVFGMLSATIISHYVTASFIFFKLHTYKYISIKAFDVRKLKALLKYSIPLIPNALCWWALNASDRTIVLFYLGTSYNGLLSVGHKFSSLYITFYNIFNLSWTESAALHIHDEDHEEFFNGVITSMFNLFMCAGIGIIACMPFMFPLLINIKFAEAYNVIPIFMLASMFNVVVGLYSVIYVALKRTKEIAKTSIYSGLINIIAHLCLVKWIGLYAAAVSTALAFGVMGLYRVFDLKRYANISIPIKSASIIVVMYIVTIVAYYSEQIVLQIIVLLLDAVISILLNRKFLDESVKMLKSKFLRKGKK